jgi:acetyltransferase-like isoleucine patch superfamily enzyme
MPITRFKQRWARFWMQFSGIGAAGRWSTRLASIGAPPYKGRKYLAKLSPRGYISPNANIYHTNLDLGQNIFIGERVEIYQSGRAGQVKIGDGTHIHRDCIIETGEGGNLIIGAHTHIQPRCQFSAYLGSIHIGDEVQIAPNCAFYPYDHDTKPGQLIRQQPVKSRGDIVLGNDVWLGTGAIILQNVEIGDGAVIGAGSVVTHDIPKLAVACGVPAKVISHRNELNHP